MTPEISDFDVVSKNIIKYESIGLIFKQVSNGLSTNAEIIVNPAGFSVSPRWLFH